MSKLSKGSLVYEGVSFLFGDGTPYRLTGFERGVASARGDDADRPRSDGSRFGADLKSGPSHSIALVVLGDGPDREASVGERAAVLERAFDAGSLRASHGVLAKLTIGDRYCYGRPRDLAPDDSGRWDGVAEYVASFVAESDRWYGQTVSRTVRFSPVFTGGLPVTAAVPFVLGGGGGEADVAISVAGDFAAWPVFTVSGPVKDAYIDVSGAGRLALRGEVKAGQRLVVDTRPWARSVTLNGAAFPGALSPVGDRMSDMSLAPGSHLVVFGGHDPSGTSSLTVSVEQAYASF